MIKREFKIMSLPRTGTHAISMWIYSAFDEPKMHRTTRHDKPAVRVIGLPKNDNRITINAAVFTLERFCITEFASYRLCAIGCSAMPDMRNHTVERSDNVLVVRDPFNMVASLLKSGADDDRVNDCLNKIEHYLEQTLGIESYVPDCQIILYNKWFACGDYRKGIANNLEIQPDPEAVNDVPNFGDGSSFDRRIFNKRAQKMDVLNRYKKYLNNEQYRNLIVGRKKLRKMAKLVFGFDPLEN
jgi:hypothetical protein